VFRRVTAAENVQCDADVAGSPDPGRVAAEVLVDVGLAPGVEEGLDLGGEHGRGGLLVGRVGRDVWRRARPRGRRRR
jgi:hypothetical protein